MTTQKTTGPAKIQAVLFDMDGGLIEAKDWHYEALNRALEIFGMPISRSEVGAPRALPRSNRPPAASPSLQPMARAMRCIASGTAAAL